MQSANYKNYPSKVITTNPLQKHMIYMEMFGHQSFRSMLCKIMDNPDQVSVGDSGNMISPTMLPEEDLSDDPSSGESSYDEHDLLDISDPNDVAARLAAAGESVCPRNKQN